MSSSGLLLQQEKCFAVLGLGSVCAISCLDKQLADKDDDNDHDAINEQCAMELCRWAIELVIQWDGSSCGLICVHVIDGATGTRQQIVVNPWQNSDTASSISGSLWQTLPGFATAMGGKVKLQL